MTLCFPNTFSWQYGSQWQVPRCGAMITGEKIIPTLGSRLLVSMVEQLGGRNGTR